MENEPAKLAIPTSLKERRKAMKWSQERLAHESGVSTVTIHNLETSKNGFTDKSLAALARALGCTPAELLTPVDQAPPTTIRGEAQILSMLGRIEGLTDYDVSLAFGMISAALAKPAAPAPSESRGQSAPASRRREVEPSR